MSDALGSPAANGRSYWALVWAQFRRDRLAVAGLVCVALLFLVAIYAPILANDKPLLLKAGGEWRAPLLRQIFAPTESPEKMLERIFNFMLVFCTAGVLLLTPLVLILKRLARRWKPALLGAAAALLAATLAPFFLVSPRLDNTDYRKMTAEAGGGGWALMPPVPFSPYEQFVSHQRPDRVHLMGTDKVGRDVLARVIHGARVSLSVGFLAVGVAVVIGILVGAVSAYYGGWVDMLVQRLVEIVICLPTFLLILIIMALIEKRSIFNVMLVIGLTGWTGIARLVRGQMLSEKELDYVTAAKALGARPRRVMFRHLLPNSIAPVLVSVTFGVAGAILTETGLSFLGFGVSPPTASWGELLNQALAWPIGYWWLTTWPGFLIFFTVTIYNLVGEGLRDAMDPRMRM